MSMNQHVTDSMKARDAEEQMLAAQNEDQAAKRFGYQTGTIDSPWLASERAANVRSADQGILRNRQNIDIEAARTNTADLRSAIGTLGQIANSTKDRFALNEQLKIEAARLGLSERQLLQQLQQYESDPLSTLT